MPYSLHVPQGLCEGPAAPDVGWEQRHRCEPWWSSVGCARNATCAGSVSLPNTHVHRCSRGMMG